MFVAVDLTSLFAVTHEAERELAPLAMRERLLEPLRRAAADERFTHPYQRRTGRLERSTRATIAYVRVGEVAIDLKMDAPYATFVARRGLSTLDVHRAAAEQEIEAELSALLEKLSR